MFGLHQLLYIAIPTDEWCIKMNLSLSGEFMFTSTRNALFFIGPFNKWTRDAGSVQYELQLRVHTLQ